MIPRNEIDFALSMPGFHLEIKARWEAEALAILGPSGAGKSTTLEVLAGVRRADSARVTLGGRRLDDSEANLHVPAARREIGWVPQDGSLFPHLSVRENVRFGARRSADPAALARAIDLLEIERLLERRPADLSGGERQRVALARALASGPRVLLLDEPLASLDMPLRARIFPYLLRLRDDARIPILYVTHDASEALGLARHVLVVEGGHVVTGGSPEELLRSPAALRLMDLVGIENRLRVLEASPSPEDGVTRLRTRGGLTISAPPAIAVEAGGTVGIRAEDILVGIETPRGLSAQNVLVGSVEEIAEREGRILVAARCGGEILHIAITRHALADLGLATGRKVWLVFKALAVHPIP